MQTACTWMKSLLKKDPQAAWQEIFAFLWEKFSSPILVHDPIAEVVRRERSIEAIELLLSHACWDLWSAYDTSVPHASAEILSFWDRHPQGKAVLLLDGLSLREVPWILAGVQKHGYHVHAARVCGAELPPDTTSFANALHLSQRSILQNNGAGSAHKLHGATTECTEVPWRECIEMVGASPYIFFWHGWPDFRLHDLSSPGQGLEKITREAKESLGSEDFWQWIHRLTTGRRLLITSDHGYAASGFFPDTTGEAEVTHLKKWFKSGRFSPGDAPQGEWVPPIELQLTTSQGPCHFVLGRRKWKSAGGYPTLTHGGLSLMEVAIPFIELSR